MSSKQKLIEEIQQLDQSEILRMRGYLYEIKRAKSNPSNRAVKGAQRVRKALKNVSTSLSDDMNDMRNERL